ncbi:hypothetical protein L13192_07304 [Pyrenophora tritici-repentis]|nr:hypothetical protein L13192_07304 [Pyrenophora tritici-repentis]
MLAIPTVANPLNLASIRPNQLYHPSKGLYFTVDNADSTDPPVHNTKPEHGLKYAIPP